MNKKGQAILLGMMWFVFAMIVATILVKPILDVTGLSRDADHLDCENSSISQGAQLTCIAVDLNLPFFIIAVLTAGIGLIFLKVRS